MITIKYDAGPFIASQSSWLRTYGYARDTDRTKGIRSFLGIGQPKGIAIVFKSGARCFYPGTTIEQYRRLVAAKSKGKWVWRNIYNTPYQLF